MANPGKVFIKAAEKSSNISVSNGSKHYKFEGINPETGKREAMFCPYEIKGKGTECKIRKWLLKMGVILVIIFLIIYFI